MSWIALTTPTAIAIALLGIFALWRGLVGRRVGDHPCCRRCGFDLFGRPQDSHVCPECGADLTGKRPTVIGIRHRRHGLIAAGIALLLPAVGILGILAWGRARDVDWNQHKPLAWLIRDAEKGDSVTRSAALKEIFRRSNANTLAATDFTRIVDAGLRAQGDLTRPW